MGDDNAIVQSPYTPYEKKYMDTVNDLKNTFLKKNADYGSSVKKNYDKLEKYGENEGLKYVFGRISEKYDRLENLIYGNHQNKVIDESIADTLLDMANYAILAAISFKEHKELKKNNTILYKADKGTASPFEFGGDNCAEPQPQLQNIVSGIVSIPISQQQKPYPIQGNGFYADIKEKDFYGN